eukprot:gnl/Hemi2/23205_TR7779_c0_g1_i1.p1 gnl/Hemi2/23205_TR7779_c0_g1~~gnl/Hemi2/23205_TR7779_c0_g1_i1.p1  ORF type:complete len:217 (+),score=66.64 gnl/Hemi2/23205_TR7779_c0_g1_i1:43-651(+)
MSERVEPARAQSAISKWLMVSSPASVTKFFLFCSLAIAPIALAHQSFGLLPGLASTRTLSAISSVWVGAIIAISCLESWVKLQTPTLPRQIAFDVGAHVFSALNRLELALAFAAGFVASNAVRAGALPGQPGSLVNSGAMALGAAGVIVVGLQSLWLLPSLIRRSQLFVAGTPPPPSSAHSVMVGLEFVKLGCLLFASYAFL